MNKLIVLLLCCLLLTGCASAPAEPTAPAPAETKPPALAETTAPIQEAEETAAPVHYLTLYAPNEDATGFIYGTWELAEISADSLCDALIGAEVLNADVRFNSLTVEGSQIKLDVNFAFQQQLFSYGTAGEYMMMGSVVNTLLNAYGAETVYITVDGQILESGHVIYDFPQQFYN